MARACWDFPAPGRSCCAIASDCGTWTPERIYRAIDTLSGRPHWLEVSQLMPPPLLFSDHAGRGGGRLFQKARRAVMLKNLFVHIPTERPQRPVVDAAVSLAAACAAHLDAASIGFETTNVDLAPDGGAALAAVIEIGQERALARANAALAV